MVAVSTAVSLRRAKLLLAIIIGCFVLATGYISMLIVKRQNALQQVSRYNTAWLASQAVAEYTRLEQRIGAFAVPGAGISKDEVERRFDIVLSRVKLMQGGEFQEFILSEPDRIAAVQQLSTVLDLIQPLIKDIEAPGTVQRALQILMSLDATLAGLASAANRFGGARVAQDQRELIRLHWLFTALTGGLIVSGISLIVLLFWHNRVLDRARSELSEVTRDLQTKANLLETMLETIDQGLVMFDATDAVQIYNRRALEILNLPRDFIETKPTVEAIDKFQLARGESAETRVGFAAHVVRSADDKKAHVYEQRRPNGTVVEVRTSHLSKGATVSTYTDITTRKSAELAKDNFLAMMSHEIRTPLAGLLGVTDLLASEQLGSKQHNYVESIRASGRHLLAILNSVIDFSRIQAEKIELEQLDFSVAKVIADVRSLMAPKALERGLEFRCELNELSPRIVKGDPTRLTQVLINLVDNALKFTHYGEVSLSVSDEGEQNGLIQLRFDVRDTGVGISSDKWADVFNPFVQGDNSTTRRYGGSGLGLAISQRLIEAMGGTIKVDSVPDAGSHFWFELLFEKGAARHAAENFELERINGPPRRVLIAEDVELNRTLLREMLVQHGHDVVLAENGARAVELVAREQFHLVLMDVQMPLMDGIEATRQIRQLDEPSCTIPVIGLTASTQLSERERYIAAGMNECLTKPINWTELFSAVKRYTRTGEKHARIAPGDQCSNLATPLLNRKTIRELSNNLSSQQLGVLFQRAIYDSEHAASRLEQLLRDPTELGREAHTLKGIAGLFGLQGISAIASEIEQAVRDDRDAAELLTKLGNTLIATRIEMSSLFNVGQE